MRLIDTAAETVPRDQPNASSSGSMRTLGVARNDPAATRATKATAATTHARWIRRAGCAAATEAVVTDRTVPVQSVAMADEKSPARSLSRYDSMRNFDATP